MKRKKRGKLKKVISVLAICGLIAAQMFSGKIAVSYAEGQTNSKKLSKKLKNLQRKLGKIMY